MKKLEIKEELHQIRDEASILLETYLNRPKMRGVIHSIGAVVSLVAMVILIIIAKAHIQELSAAIYGAGLTLALATSAFYHRGRWKPRVHRLLRKLDHSMIFILIATSYTPIILLTLNGGWRISALLLVWVFCLTSVALRMSVKQLPRAVMVGISITLGWGALSLMPAINSASTTALALVMLSGILYTIGGIIYLLKRPDPLPTFFGFHEVFHTLVVVAASLHYAALWPLVTV